MSILDVPGAHLYYETRGDGPLLVLIPGAAGAAEPYRMLAAQLSSSSRVVLYDRRGFSRSALNGPQDYDRRLETDADDVRHLIEDLKGEPAIVFGGSSGAIVALQVLIQHSAVVRGLIAHEPPLMRQLTDGQRWLDFFLSVYETYRSSGVVPAQQQFRERTFAVPDQQVMAHVPTNEFSEANSEYWFEHELRQYPAARLDTDGLKAHADLLVVGAGSESRGHPCFEASKALSKKLGRELIEFPGGHLGYVARAGEFATVLQRHLGAD
jgi:pimeloyl-ACP methyl ester carboxylesterase